MLDRFIRPSARIQASITAANVKNSVDNFSKHFPAQNGHDGIDVQPIRNQGLAVCREHHWLEPTDENLNRIRRGANWLIYASVVLGVGLLAQLYLLKVPAWLIDSILVGWILYLVVAVAVATSRDKAYLAALALSIVTLGVSLPQPEHYSLTNAGPTLASLTFIVGSLLQIGVIVLITYLMVLRRRKSSNAGI